MLTANRVSELKSRHARFTKWKRDAERYFEQHGRLGDPMTRARHKHQLEIAERELPEIEQQLRDSWKEES